MVDGVDEAEVVLRASPMWISFRRSMFFPSPVSSKIQMFVFFSSIVIVIVLYIGK